MPDTTPGEVDYWQKKTDRAAGGSNSGLLSDSLPGWHGGHNGPVFEEAV